MSTREAQIAASGGSIHEFRKASRKMRWWYEALADYMITHPAESQKQVAAAFGRQECTISTIVNTDAFKAYFRQRRDHHAEQIDTAMRGKLMAVADKSLDQILAVIDKKRDTIPLEMLQRVTESSLKSLGYGVAPPQGAVNVNISNQPQHVHVAVSVEDLEAARNALRRSQNQLPPPIDVTASEASYSPCEAPPAVGRSEASGAGDSLPEQSDD